jgi:hypothetical protein
VALTNKSVISGLDRFTRATSRAVPRIISSSYGDYGSGKTHFYLTAPGPIVVMSFDKGLEGVVEPFAEDKEIRVIEYDWAPTFTAKGAEFREGDFSQEEAIKMREQFIADFEFVCQHARTVVIDKETDLWNLYRYAEHGGPSDRPNNYMALNQRYRKLVNFPKKLTINFGLVQALRDEWVTIQGSKGQEKGSPSGKRKRDGFKELEGLTHIDLFHEAVGVGFQVSTGKARSAQALAIQNQTYSMLDFATLGQLMFPESSENDWA